MHCTFLLASELLHSQCLQAEYDYRSKSAAEQSKRGWFSRHPSWSQIVYRPGRLSRMRFDTGEPKTLNVNHADIFWQHSKP